MQEAGGPIPCMLCAPGKECCRRRRGMSGPVVVAERGREEETRARARAQNQNQNHESLTRTKRRDADAEGARAHLR